ncbi:MAG: diacylglycerol kinase family lipid kinase [Bacteroidales bacterium]|nr:diacylglycerol kinase family lipid kinase [Bacteroidales bacterium]
MEEISTYRRIIIINPMAGRKKQTSLLINKLIDFLEKQNLRIPVKFSGYTGHAREITRDAIDKGYKHFIVVGGNGTLHEVASVLIHYPETTLSLVAAGSGNGLANHLKIPSEPENALMIALRSQTTSIDIGWINDVPFFSVAGIGFDAYIARRFSYSHRRGFLSYVKHVMLAYPFYKPKIYTITIDGNTIITKALMITFANSNQYGNSISLAPDASLSDGMIDLIVMKKVPIWLAIFLWPLLFMKILHKTSFVKVYRVRDVIIQLHQKDYLHVDGDPFPLRSRSLKIYVQPQSLRISIP